MPKKHKTKKPNLKQRVVFLWNEHQPKIRFLVVGGVNTLLDFVTFGILANTLGMFAVFANMISTFITMTISFFLNYNFVWHSKKSKRWAAPRFLAVSLFSAWVIQSGIIWIITSIFGTADATNLIAKIIGISIATIFNYLGYKLIFK
jgi:putative flippase GtrA